MELTLELCGLFSWGPRLGTKGQREAGTAALLLQHLSRKDKGHSFLFTPSALTACRDEDISMLLLTLCKYFSTCLAKYWVFSPQGKSPSCNVVCDSAEAGAESGGVPYKGAFPRAIF